MSSDSSAAQDASETTAGRGFTMMELLELPEAERVVARWLIRRGEADTQTLAEQMKLPEAVIREALLSLAARGFVDSTSVGESGASPCWRAILVSRRMR